MPGTLTYSPAEVTQQVLVDLGLGTYPATPPAEHDLWPIFYDNLPNQPNNAMGSVDTQGIEFRGNAHGGRNEHHGVQVLVRGGTARVGWAKARAVAQAANQKGRRYVTVNNVTYCFRFVKKASGPLRLGPEQNSTRRLYSINILVYCVQE